jgi:mono/diheme cytochrome c family protein
MLSTIAFVVAALSSSHKLGLALVGGAFIAFALISAFVIPRYRPDFPGKGMGWFIVVCVLFFLAMVSAVIVFGREAPETKAETTTGTGTTTTTTTTTATTTTSSGPAIQGDPAAGKAIFASAGCASCHTLKAAGSTGTVGPNLDQLKPAYRRIVLQVEHGGKIMPSFSGTLKPNQINDVAAFVYASTHP